MSTPNTNAEQGPFVGSRCVAGPDGRWGAGIIRRVNEDGTFTIELDDKPLLLMPCWYGVTPGEVSFNEAQRWAGVFAEFSPNRQTFDQQDFQRALPRLGFITSPEEVAEFWSQSCQRLSPGAAHTASVTVLDRESTYRLFLQMGVSARWCQERLQGKPPDQFFKLYWNQIRMGGRDPAEVARLVTLEDALAALGLTKKGEDKATVAFLRTFEKDNAITLPRSLKALLCRRGAEDAVANCHPNNPNTVPWHKNHWHLQRRLKEKGLLGEYGVVITLPHQGDHEWAVVFNDGEEDGRVYVRWNTEEGEQWLLTAPDVGFFFWDLAQTGLAWFQETRFEGGKAVQQTDIGLIPR